MAGEDAPEKTIDASDVVDKYKTAADIANRAVDAVVAALAPGKSIVELCNLGDSTIRSQCASVYSKAKDGKGAKVQKGVAFPTCVSVNHCAGHFSPLSTEDAVLGGGDLCTIDLGAHIDGYVAVTTVCAHVGSEVAVELPPRAADAVHAAYYAAEASLRLLRPGVKNTQMSALFADVAADFGCSVVEGVLSHEMKRYVMDGERCALSKPSPERRVAEFEIEPNTVFAVDVAMSTSAEGKVKPSSTRTTVYKRAVDVDYMLKIKASRQLLNDINHSSSAVLPFTLRTVSSEEKIARIGITEMCRHNMVVGFPVLHEKEGEYVARFKYTALVLPSQTQRITKMALPAGARSEKSVQNERVRELLARSVSKSSKSGAKKKKKQQQQQQRREEEGGTEAAAPAADGNAMSDA